MMKTILLSLLFTGIAIMAQAQFTEPGQKVLSSSFGFQTGNNSMNNSPNNNNINGTAFNINAGFGKFIKKNVLSSFTLSYANSVTKQTAGFSSKSVANSFSGAYSQTYYKELAKRFYFGIQGSIGAGYHKANTNTTNIDYIKSEGYQVGAGISPVFNYQLTNRFLLSLSPSVAFLGINYNSARIRYIQSNQTINTGEAKSFSLNTGFWSSPLSNLSVGFSYLLKRK